MKDYKIMSGECEKCHEHTLDCKCDYESERLVYLRVMDIIEEFNLGFNLQNAIKYILRSRKKGEFNEDLEKAIWYLKRELEK